MVSALMETSLVCFCGAHRKSPNPTRKLARHLWQARASNIRNLKRNGLYEYHLLILKPKKKKKLFHGLCCFIILAYSFFFFYLSVTPETVPRSTKPTVSSALDISETTLGNSKKYFLRRNKVITTATTKNHPTFIAKQLNCFSLPLPPFHLLSPISLSFFPSLQAVTFLFLGTIPLKS